MNKFSFIGLWDVYCGLLTETQQEITNLYFNFDLTVSEIAEEKGISRQAVSECLKGCKTQLEEYEDKLHFLERLQRIGLENSCRLTDAGKWAERIAAAYPELTAEVEKLTKIIGKDYFEEVKDMLSKPETKELLRKDYTEEVYGHKKTGEQ